jgi:hypothetical protein
MEQAMRNNAENGVNSRLPDRKTDLQAVQKAWIALNKAETIINLLI